MRISLTAEAARVHAEAVVGGAHARTFAVTRRDLAGGLVEGLVEHPAGMRSRPRRTTDNAPCVAGNMASGA